MVVERNIARNCAVAGDICDHGRGASPENDRFRIWVTELDIREM